MLKQLRAVEEVVWSTGSAQVQKKKNIESVPHTCCVKWFAHKKLNLRLKKIHSI